MKQQNDWYTGIDYYDTYREKEIVIEEKIIYTPIKQLRHDQVEILYVLSGQGVIKINGCDYPGEAGSFFCMYSHHFYHIHEIREPLEVVFVKFYIGLFMYMSWEKHPKHANASLMYDTCPMVALTGGQREAIEHLIEELLQEKKESRFGSMNMIEYKTLALHTYFCRYAYEHIGVNQKEQNEVWNMIQKIVLSTGKALTLKDIAEELHCSANILNQKIKAACGYTFFQLQQYSKVLNACALLHFPELSMEYISDLLDFSSKTAFYRVFAQYCQMTPRDYQKRCIGNEEMMFIGTGLAMQFLQYLHLNFMENIRLEDLCEEFRIKPYTATQLFLHVFGRNFHSVLNEIRVCYTTSFLRASEYSITDISAMCGFDSLSTFQRAFQAYMNQTPSQYKKSMQ